MVPVIIVAASVLILHEQIASLEVAGTSFTLIGLFPIFYSFYFHYKWQSQRTGSLLQSSARMPGPYIVTPKVFQNLFLG